MPSLPVATECLDGGAIWRVVLGGSKGNILDAALVKHLEEAFARARADAALKAIVLEGAGAHFSFGASVEEHLAEHVEGMLRDFARLLLSIIDASVTVIAVVRGQCLGGGLELATACHRIVASPDARLGQPEIQLGVMAPFASILLPGRVGRGAAEDLCISGRSVDAAEALRLSLIDEVAPDPLEAALAYARTHLLARSAASLRHAVRGIRLALRDRFVREWPALERLYLDELMATSDANEGLRAFIEKRPASWRNR